MIILKWILIDWCYLKCIKVWEGGYIGVEFCSGSLNGGVIIVGGVVSWSDVFLNGGDFGVMEELKKGGVGIDLSSMCG